MPFDESAHPRGEAGTATGGQFVAAQTTTKTTTAKKGGGGSMSYDPKTKRGTGYGRKGGDPRVRKLQALLNKLGLKDAKGRPLAVDGQLGPLTTQAIKAAQRKYGMPVTGKVDGAFIKRLQAGGKPRTKTSRLRGKPRTGGPKKKSTTERGAKDDDSGAARNGKRPGARNGRPVTADARPVPYRQPRPAAARNGR